jgi:hypothetical protein
MGNKLSCYSATTCAAWYVHTAVPGMKNVVVSPFAIGKHVYINGRDGATVIIKSADQCEIVATNTLDTTLDTSPVVIGDERQRRGSKRIYCISTTYRNDPRNQQRRHSRLHCSKSRSHENTCAVRVRLHRNYDVLSAFVEPCDVSVG